MNYSQSIFAMVLNVSTKTVQAWESAERSPSGASLRLLEVIDKGFDNSNSIKSRPKKKQKTARKEL
jgi:DNA-binding transcriptional regulator YiaG